MLKPSNAKLGSELGLSGRFANVPAFQIVNDAHNLVFAITSQLADLKHGTGGGRAGNDRRWAQIDAKRTEFNRRAHALGDDAVKAASLVEEIRSFRSSVLAPIAQSAGKHE